MTKIVSIGHESLSNLAAQSAFFYRQMWVTVHNK